MSNKQINGVINKVKNSFELKEPTLRYGSSNSMKTCLEGETCYAIPCLSNLLVNMNGKENLKERDFKIKAYSSIDSIINLGIDYSLPKKSFKELEKLRTERRKQTPHAQGILKEYYLIRFEEVYEKSLPRNLLTDKGISVIRNELISNTSDYNTSIDAKIDFKDFTSLGLFDQFPLANLEKNLDLLSIVFPKKDIILEMKKENPTKISLGIRRDVEVIFPQLDDVVDSILQ